MTPFASHLLTCASRGQGVLGGSHYTFTGATQPIPVGSDGSVGRDTHGVVNNIQLRAVSPLTECAYELDVTLFNVVIPDTFHDDVIVVLFNVVDPDTFKDDINEVT